MPHPTRPTLPEQLIPTADEQSTEARQVNPATIQRPSWFPFLRSRDVMVMLILGLGAGIFSYHGQRSVPPALLHHAGDNWFQADNDRVVANMTNRRSDHNRVKVHPLFSITTYPPTFILRKSLGLAAEVAASLLLAFVASLWVATLFLVLRSMGSGRIDATLFTLCGAMSSAAMFWFVVPETYPFGSLTILLTLLFVAVVQRRRVPDGWYIGLSALTLSMTITNWMVGLLAAFTARPWRGALQITINAFALVTILWSVQKVIFPSAVFFLGDREEVSYLAEVDRTWLLEASRAFAFHSIVMPAVQAEQFPPLSGNVQLSVQKSGLGSAGFHGAVATGIWAALLSLGVWSLVTLRQHLQWRLVLTGTLLGQLVLHLLYGSETFLYSLHFAPLLIVLAAHVVLTPARPVARLLAVALIVFGGINNAGQLLESTAHLTEYATTQSPVLPVEDTPAADGSIFVGEGARSIGRSR